MKRYLEITFVACQRGLVTVVLCMFVLFVSMSFAQADTQQGTNTQPETSNNAITLSWVLEKTLLSNIRLQTFPYELRVNEALTIQAGITPNPEFSVEVENVLGTGDKQGVDNAEISLGLSQLVELGDKRQRRIDFAQAGERQKLAEYELIRLDILSQATQAYYQVLRLQALQAWNLKRIEVEDKALKTIESRAKAGAVAQADVTKMALRLMRARAVQQALEGDTQIAKHRLAAMWSSEAHFDRVVGELDMITVIPTAASVLNAIETAPQYLQLLSVERLMYAKRRMEESKAQYDITLGVGVRSYDGFDDGALMFNLSMPILLSNPNQGNILAAKANEDMAMEQQKLARGQLKLTLLEIHQIMINNARQASQLKEELLPLAQRLLKETQSAYQTGQANVLQLVDAQTELFNVERELIEAKVAVYQQRLELERITGQSMTTALSNVYTSPISNNPLNVGLHTEPKLAQENK
ncbi:TolC family protein [Shewanella sp. D64]|uniref:TolC family protein n=1 Tax=unclassified Shewanella TaxID=196818 RepID=UPI0022BA56F3|nr:MULTISPECIES: TolC family protein [unclassified Shewanella]MEC4724638.1 TolC family protein [Shewanella sp. D64]MEC4736585.1 TolC family protein [Shewanella sp. E94]WBJ94740.1 TolC family protein [Shewanella sp. MTB7]